MNNKLKYEAFEDFGIDVEKAQESIETVADAILEEVDNKVCAKCLEDILMDLYFIGFINGRDYGMAQDNEFSRMLFKHCSCGGCNGDCGDLN